MSSSWDASVFDRLYAADEDPWNFRSSAYERTKYEATMHLLPPRRFVSALEIGCSIGVLTAMLAQRCDELLAIDCAQAALGRAARACAVHSHVRFERHHVPASFPAGCFELIVISEVLYFLSPDDIATLASLCVAGTVILANWTGETDTPCTGEQAADAFIAASGLALSETRRAETFRLDLLR